MTDKWLCSVADQTVFDLACSEEIKQILEDSRDKVRCEKNTAVKSC